MWLFFVTIFMFTVGRFVYDFSDVAASLCFWSGWVHVSFVVTAGVLMYIDAQEVKDIEVPSDGEEFAVEEIDAPFEVKSKEELSEREKAILP